MKKLFIAAFLLFGVASISFAQTITKTKTKKDVVKTKENGVKTKENKMTGEVKKKDDMGKTKTKVDPGKMKTKGDKVKVKEPTVTTKTKTAAGDKTKTVTKVPLKKDGTPDKRFKQNKTKNK